jgi:hypothetical protein
VLKKYNRRVGLDLKFQSSIEELTVIGASRRPLTRAFGAEEMELGTLMHFFCPHSSC